MFILGERSCEGGKSEVEVNSGQPKSCRYMYFYENNTCMEASNGGNGDGLCEFGDGEMRSSVQGSSWQMAGGVA